MQHSGEASEQLGMKFKTLNTYHTAACPAAIIRALNKF